MSENTPTTAELIGEARTASTGIIPFHGPRRTAELIGQLADALEAALGRWSELTKLSTDRLLEVNALTVERDALAATLAAAPHWFGCAAQFQRGQCRCWKSKLPADALAAHDAGIWDDGHKAGWYDRDGDVHVGLVPSGYAQDAPNPYRIEREAQ